MNRLTALILTVAILCVSLSATADTPSIGYEVGSCTPLDSAHYNTTDLNLWLTWFRGFVSGRDFTAEPHRNNVRLVDEATIVQSVSKFCLAHPNQNMLHAALNLVAELQQSDKTVAAEMKENPSTSASYQKLPKSCQRIIDAELACSSDALQVDKRANPSFVDMDQKDLDAAKRQLYLAMPHIGETKGVPELDMECKSSYLALVHGMEGVDTRDIRTHGGDPSHCESAVKAAEAVSATNISTQQSTGAITHTTQGSAGLASYQKVPALCQKLIEAQVACYRNKEAVDKNANPSGTLGDQVGIANAEHALYITMPNTIRLRGVSALEAECRTRFRTLVLGMGLIKFD